MNKPRTAKVGAIFKAQNCRRGPLGFCETPACCKILKKLEGELFWGLEKVSQKFLKMRFFKSVTVSKNVKGGDFFTSIVL